MHNSSTPSHSHNQLRHKTEPAIIRWFLIAIAVSIISVLIVIPVLNVFFNAIEPGIIDYWRDHKTSDGSWFAAIGNGFTSYRDSLFLDSDTRHAITLTLVVAPTAVILNTAFGVLAAWAIAKFDFPGKTLLTSLIDLPFAVSPVVAGLSLILIFGLQGYLGQWLRDHDTKIIFATPGLIIATSFVTLPFVARELIPLMQALGDEEEVAALSLGANAWHIFWKVTLPNIKWALLYGVILCNARAMGEFGAVYVVSGHIAGETDTMPLRVEKLFQEYNNPGSFAVASVLTMLALVTLILKTWLEWKVQRDLNNETDV